MSVSPMFYRLRSAEWKALGLPAPTKAYQLAHEGKLHLVRDGGDRVGVLAAEAERYFREETKPIRRRAAA